jgi:hypothetical protein
MSWEPRSKSFVQPRNSGIPVKYLILKVIWVLNVGSETELSVVGGLGAACGLDVADCKIHSRRRPEIARMVVDGEQWPVVVDWNSENNVSLFIATSSF